MLEKHSDPGLLLLTSMAITLHSLLGCFRQLPGGAPRTPRRHHRGTSEPHPVLLVPGPGTRMPRTDRHAHIITSAHALTADDGAARGGAAVCGYRALDA